VIFCADLGEKNGHFCCGLLFVCFGVFEFVANGRILHQKAKIASFGFAILRYAF